MTKSYDNRMGNGIVDTMSLPENLDFSQPPQNIANAITMPPPYRLEKTSLLTWDQRQFIARIPTEIANELPIQKGQYLEFKLTKTFGVDEKAKVDIKLMPDGSEQNPL